MAVRVEQLPLVLDLDIPPVDEPAGDLAEGLVELVDAPEVT